MKKLQSKHKKLLALLLLLPGTILFLTFISQTTAPEDIKHPGQYIYLGYKDPDVGCARCHGKTGRGSWLSDGPDIRDSIRKKGQDKVREYILHGKGEGDDAMPGFADKLTEEEVEQILEYITYWEKIDSLVQARKPTNGMQEDKNAQRR